MKSVSCAILKSALMLILLTAGLSAQRYTGHDHAVFHRPPQPSTPASKHGAPTQNNAKTAPRNASGASAGSSQTTSRATGQGHGDQASPQLPATETAAESLPHF